LDTPIGAPPVVSIPPAEFDPPTQVTSGNSQPGKSRHNPGTPRAPAKGSEWKLTNALVRTGPRVHGDSNRVLNADEGYEIVEAFGKPPADFTAHWNDKTGRRVMEYEWVKPRARN
jgi:hypothetical protein